MINPFKLGEPGSLESFSTWYVVTPDDDNDLPVLPRGLQISDSGVVAMTGADGVTVNMPVTEGLNMLRPKRILATGTTAGLTIIAGY